MEIDEILLKILQEIRDQKPLEEKNLTPIDVLVIKSFTKQGQITPAKNIYCDVMDERDKAGTIYSIAHRGDVEKTRQDLIRTIIHNLRQSEETEELKACLNYVVSELFNNIADHSGSEGWAMAQYYPENSKVMVCVIDCGCGFLKRIQSKFQDIKTECDAIYKAVEKGITASVISGPYEHERNAGYGLFMISGLIKQITRTKLLIASNDEAVYFVDDKSERVKLPTSLTGSLVCFSLDLEALSESEYTVDQLIGFLRQDQDECDEEFDIF